MTDATAAVHRGARECGSVAGGGAGAAATMPVIGFLHPASPDLVVDRLRAFRLGLVEMGYTEGQNVAIVYRWAENQDYRLEQLDRGG